MEVSHKTEINAEKARRKVESLQEGTPEWSKAKDEFEEAKIAANDAFDNYIAAARDWRNLEIKSWQDVGQKPVDARFRVSDYVSYVKSNKRMLKAWNLSQDEIKELKKCYIIAQDLGDEEVKGKIKGILESCVASIRKGEGFVFHIPKRHEDCMDNETSIGMPILRRTGMTMKRSFSDGRTRRNAVMTLWTLSTLLDVIEEGALITPRELYYRAKWLFKKPAVTARIILDICVMLECTTRSLHIVAQERGAICENAIIKLDVGGTVEDLDCKDGISIPAQLRNIRDIVLGKDTQSIVVVEKGTIYSHLKDNNYHKNHNCVLITAFGMPDERTRAFVRYLESKTILPIYGVMDPDPYGISIMKTYSKGSVTFAHDNLNLNTLSMHWVGISTMDMEEIHYEGKEFNFDLCPKLNLKEFKMLKNMYNSKKYALSDKWKQRINHMVRLKKKACFEDLHGVFGHKFVSQIYLPSLIRKVMETMDLKRSCEEAEVVKL